MFPTVYTSAHMFLLFCHNIHTFDGLTDRRTEFSSLYRICIPCSAATKMAISSNYVVHVAMFCGHLSHKIRKNEQTNTTQEDVKMHVLKISVGQKVVEQTSWLAHWEQKVGGARPTQKASPPMLVRLSPKLIKS